MQAHITRFFQGGVMEAADSSKSGRKKNSRFTTKLFLEAIPGTGGVIAAIAKRVGCSWITARRFIDEHPTVAEAWMDERNRVSDMAEANIIKAINEGDLSTSQWWLRVMRSDVYGDKAGVGGQVTIHLVHENWD